MYTSSLYHLDKTVEFSADFIAKISLNAYYDQNIDEFLANDAMENLINLESLVISWPFPIFGRQGHIFMEKCLIIFQKLNSCPNLKSLDLRGQGCDAFSDLILRYLPNLTKLHLVTHAFRVENMPYKVELLNE